MGTVICRDIAALLIERVHIDAIAEMMLKANTLIGGKLMEPSFPVTTTLRRLGLPFVVSNYGQIMQAGREHNLSPCPYHLVVRFARQYTEAHLYLAVLPMSVKGISYILKLERLIAPAQVAHAGPELHDGSSVMLRAIPVNKSLYHADSNWAFVENR